MINEFPSDRISRIGIVGAGTMGSSIAVALSTLGQPIKLIDKEPDYLASGMTKVNKIFLTLEKKLKEEQNSESLSAQTATLQKRQKLIEPTNDFDDLSELDLVIEAVNEDIAIKKNIFQTLDKICHEKTILASNTSSFSITQLASFTRRPQQVIGMHFFNPAHLMSLVEIIPGLKTDVETTAAVLALVKRLDKLPIEVAECASFLVNRLLGRYINEAIWVLQLGLADVKTIDDAACQTLMPIGPLRLRDMNGIDIGLAVARFNSQEYGERFKPAPLLEEMVEKKVFGKKTGSGFYAYTHSNNKELSINPQLPELIALANTRLEPPSGLPAFEPIQLFLPMINEAFLILQEKIVNPQDIDPALKAGLGMKKGLFEYAFEYGLNNCLSEIENLYKAYGERFRPAPLLKRYVWANKQSL